MEYKTRGKNKPFAEMVGWTPQYLGKLLHGSDFGLKPVLAVLRALPEINAVAAAWRGADAAGQQRK